MPIFSALPTDIAAAYRAGGRDAFGNPPERKLSDGDGNPCRHCLRNISEGAEMLVLAHKPFEGTHPYAEVGPIFLCASEGLVCLLALAHKHRRHSAHTGPSS